MLDKHERQKQMLKQSGYYEYAGEKLSKRGELREISSRV